MKKISVILLVSSLLGLAPMMFGMDDSESEPECILKITQDTYKIDNRPNYKGIQNNVMSCQTVQQLYKLSKILKSKNESNQIAQVFTSNPSLNSAELAIVVDGKQANFE